MPLCLCFTTNRIIKTICSYEFKFTEIARKVFFFLNDHSSSLPFIAVQSDLLRETLRAEAVSGNVSGNAAGFSIYDQSEGWWSVMLNLGPASRFSPCLLPPSEQSTSKYFSYITMSLYCF